MEHSVRLIYYACVFGLMCARNEIVWINKKAENASMLQKAETRRRMWRDATTAACMCVGSRAHWGDGKLPAVWKKKPGTTKASGATNDKRRITPRHGLIDYRVASKKIANNFPFLVIHPNRRNCNLQFSKRNF